jgi:hypothetical protein
MKSRGPTFAAFLRTLPHIESHLHVIAESSEGGISMLPSLKTTNAGLFSRERGNRYDYNFIPGEACS